MADTILNAEQLGEEQFAQFVNHNLLGPKPDIFAKFKLNKLSTFSTTKTMKDKKGKEIDMRINRELFAQLLLIAKARKVDMEKVLSYSLCAYPLSLATAKTAKSKLLQIIEGLSGTTI